MKLLVCTTAQAPYHKILYDSLTRRLNGARGNLEIVMLDRAAGGSSAFDQAEVIPSGTGLNLHLVFSKHKVFKSGVIKSRVSWQVFDLVRRLSPDVVWVHEYGPFNWGAILWAILARRPLIVGTEVGLENIQNFGKCAKLVRRVLRPFMSGVVAHSPAAMQPVEDVVGARIARAYYATENILSAEKVLQKSVLKNGCLHLAFIGHLIPRKGIDLLLSALSEAEKNGGKFELNIFGAMTVWCEDELKKFSGKSNIHSHGYLQGAELKSRVSRNDVFILPSRFDTYGAVTHEAASLGLPLLISRNAGSKVLVRNGENGFIFDPENIEEFSHVLMSCFDAEILQKMMKQVLVTARDFSADSNAGRVLKMIEEEIL